MLYKIKQFNPTSGQILVEFDPSFPLHVVDVPLTSEGLYITGEALDAYIKGFAPIDLINRAKQVANKPANTADIAGLAEEVITPLTQEQLDAQMAEIEKAKALEIEKFVKAALIKFGVI